MRRLPALVDVFSAIDGEAPRRESFTPTIYFHWSQTFQITGQFAEGRLTSSRHKTIRGERA